MSVFKRANWHSGLTYVRQCDQCKTKVQYTDEVLDFRPWYADGFVYCPTCQTPLRHNEKHAVNAPVEDNNATSSTQSVFCSQCGRKFSEGENFCPNCGQKRYP